MKIEVDILIWIYFDETFLWRDYISMGKGKPRLYPDKPQNNYPSVCPRYEEHNGCYYCEQGRTGDAKICKGNPHDCMKTKYHRLASRSNKQIIDEVE